MFRARSILVRVTLVVCAAAASYTVIVSTASAGWLIEGTELAGTAALATTASVKEAFQLTAGPVNVQCSGSVLNGLSPEIVSPNELVASSLVFNECKGNEVCPLVTKTIGTLPLSAQVFERTLQEDEAVFTPNNSSKLFATIDFGGSECSFAGVNGITGETTALLPTGREEKVVQLVKASTTEAGELKLASTNATLKGSALLKLADGKPFKLNGQALNFKGLLIEVLNANRLQKVGAGLWQLVFNPNKTIEFGMQNKTLNDFNLEGWIIENETNFEDVKPAKPKCEPLPFLLKKSKGNTCYRAIEPKGKKGKTNLTVTFNGGKKISITLVEF